MNKKSQYQILLIVLIVIVVINLSFIISEVNNNNNPNNIYNVTEVGGNVNGTVYKIEAGNPSSNETVGIILGVHPREHEIHEEVNMTSHDETRAAGEELANKYIVPNIAKDNPFIVVDVHEINPEYEYSNFVFSLSNRTDKINSYISKITNDVNLVDYNFDLGTSPEKVTKPIADKGINTLLVETCITDSLSQKHKTADNLIRSLDGLAP